MKQQNISKRRRQVLMMGADTVAAPAIAMPVIEGSWSLSSAGAVGGPCGESGVNRAACELALRPPGMASISPEAVTL